MALPQKRPLNISTKEFKKQKNTNKNLSSANVIVAMKNIYNENHTNSTDTTNKNEKETEMEAFQKLVNRNF